MLLTREEFGRLRPELQWGLKEAAGTVYHTLQTQNDTRLFWLDFLRTIFAGKFAQQRAVAQIPNFDITQPVLLTDELDLLLPDVLETAVYYADNRRSPSVRFVTLAGVSQLTILAVAIATLVACALLSLVAPPQLRKILLAQVL